MATAKNLFVRFGADFQDFFKGMKKAKDATVVFNKKMRQQISVDTARTEKQVNDFNAGIFSSMEGMKSVAAGAAAAIGAIFAGVALGKDAMKYEAIMKNIEFRLGETTKVFNSWIEEQSRGFGMAKIEAASYGQAYLAMTGTFSKSQQEQTDKAIKLLEQSAVIAAGTGRTMYDVLERIRSGMLGNTEAIEDLGVSVSVAALEQTEAFRKYGNGVKNWDSITNEAVKLQIRYYGILEQAAKSFGTNLQQVTIVEFNRFVAQMRNAQLAIQQAFLPVLSVVLPILNKLADGLEYAARWVATFTNTLYRAIKSTTLSELEKQNKKWGTYGSQVNRANKSLEQQKKINQKTAAAIGSQAKAQNEYNKALKKSMSFLLGIDELNLMPKAEQPSGGAIGGGGGGGAGGYGGDFLLNDLPKAIGEFKDGLFKEIDSAAAAARTIVEFFAKIRDRLVEIGLPSVFANLATAVAAVTSAIIILKTTTGLLVSAIKTAIQRLAEKFSFGKSKEAEKLDNISQNTKNLSKLDLLSKIHDTLEKIEKCVCECKCKAEESDIDLTFKTYNIYGDVKEGEFREVDVDADKDKSKKDGKGSKTGKKGKTGIGGKLTGALGVLGLAAGMTQLSGGWTKEEIEEINREWAKIQHDAIEKNAAEQKETATTAKPTISPGMNQAMIDEQIRLGKLLLENGLLTMKEYEKLIKDSQTPLVKAFSGITGGIDTENKNLSTNLSTEQNIRWSNFNSKILEQKPLVSTAAKSVFDEINNQNLSVMNTLSSAETQAARWGTYGMAVNSDATKTTVSTAAKAVFDKIDEQNRNVMSNLSAAGTQAARWQTYGMAVNSDATKTTVSTAAKAVFDKIDEQNRNVMSNLSAAGTQAARWKNYGLAVNSKATKTTVSTAAKAAFEELKTQHDETWKGVNKGITTNVDAYGKKLKDDDIAGKVGDFWSDIWSKVKSTFDSVWSTVSSAISSTSSWLSGLFKSDSKQSNPASSQPKIPLARGGIVDRPMMSQVGEAGAEMVVPLENTSFVRRIANAIGTAVGNSMGTNQQAGSVNLSIDGIEFAKVINPHLAKENQRIGKNLMTLR